MAKPKTTYTSGFPNSLYANDIVRERSGQEGVEIQSGLHRNVHTVEIQAIQSYIGPHPTQGWTAGDDTVNERMVKLGGTGACAEEGDICNYNTVDPSGFMVQNTGILVAQWINPTGVPYTSPAPPAGNPGVPWPGPGGPQPNAPGNGGGPNNPVGPSDVYPSPVAPWNPNNPDVQPFGPWNGPAVGGAWNFQDFLQWLTWSVDTSMLRHEWQSAETINLWPREYTDLPDPIATVIDLFEGWPTSRISPGSLSPTRATIFDLLMPMSGVLNFILGILGISVATGTVSGSTVIFNVPLAINGGTAGATAAEVGAIFSNSSDASYATSLITDVRVSPGGGTIVGNGVQAPGNYEIVFSGALDTTSGTEVLVFYRRTLFHA